MTDTQADVLGIIERAAAAHGRTVGELLGRGRTSSVVKARTEAMQRIREQYGWSPLEIGRVFGRDRATVVSHLRKAG